MQNENNGLNETRPIASEIQGQWQLRICHWIWQHGVPWWCGHEQFQWMVRTIYDDRELEKSINPYKIYKHSVCPWNDVQPHYSFSSVQSLSRVRLFETPWITARQASLSITNCWSSLRLTSIESVMPSSHLILCRPLLLLPPIPPSIKVFSNESILCMRWPKYWSFSFSISPSKEIPGLTSFRMDWLDLRAVQGTLKSLKSLLQYHSSKASIIRHSASFVV